MSVGLLTELQKEKEWEGTVGSWPRAKLGSDRCGNQLSRSPDVLYNPDSPFILLSLPLFLFLYCTCSFPLLPLSSLPLYDFLSFFALSSILYLLLSLFFSFFLLFIFIHPPPSLPHFPFLFCFSPFSLIFPLSSFFFLPLLLYFLSSYISLCLFFLSLSSPSLPPLLFFSFLHLTL